MNKPFAEACLRNRDPILSALKQLLATATSVLEVGSGTGQHAVYFADKLPHLTWYSSDREESLQGIQLWLDEAGLANTPAAIHLDVRMSEWPVKDIDAVFSANTTHIMSWPEVSAFISAAGKHLADDGMLILYGPFNYAGQFTSNSNKLFDQMLRQRDPDSGIRNFEDIQALADASGMTFVERFDMPANNQILYWKKIQVSNDA